MGIEHFGNTHGFLLGIFDDPVLSSFKKRRTPMFENIMNVDLDDMKYAVISSRYNFDFDRCYFYLTDPEDHPTRESFLTIFEYTGNVSINRAKTVAIRKGKDACMSKTLIVNSKDYREHFPLLLPFTEDGLEQIQNLIAMIKI